MESSTVEQGARTGEHGGSGAKQPWVPVSAGSSAPGQSVDPPDLRAEQVREWLFLLLRFAITRDPEDELAALMMATKIDLIGRQWGKATPTFFRRSSHDVCKAIRDLDDPKRELILKKHIQRIEHPQLRRVFQAAVRSDGPAPQRPDQSHQPGLWAGLRR